MTALATQLQQENGADSARTQASDDGAVVLLRHAFAASEGTMGQPGQLRLGLALGGGGRLWQRSAAATLQGHWQPGQFTLVLPGDDGHYASPAVDLLGLAIDTRLLPLQGTVEAAALQPLAARLQRDPVITAVLQALWCSAQADACLPGFLQHGAQVVLHRLAQLAGQPAVPRRAATPLSPRQVRTLEDYIDAHRDDALEVTRLAAVLQMEVSRFNRALHAATGLPPYAFLTRRRMQWAGQALRAGRSVTDVALASGYANPSKFSAAFRRVMGCVPSAWADRRYSADGGDG
ncbi:AraC family transcriptional regulator [Stenotrophomonas sp. 24(2023)]|uniref:helix-turn-helix domain-containing protein n=1 Tax=Stenotrophomonas sp. 24(2023) TaxID=3068324 RepID=UPI0027E1B61E|nr:AraC family transcriptional regulator [Stenotrophomonas sp. 24(2023)]WMJ69333.1 AraC family transcriptional regulator [Stenotrophomonas sp. 24(2023)]